MRRYASSENDCSPEVGFATKIFHLEHTRLKTRMDPTSKALYSMRSKGGRMVPTTLCSGTRVKQHTLSLLGTGHRCHYCGEIHGNFGCSKHGVCKRSQFQCAHCAEYRYGMTEYYPLAQRTIEASTDPRMGQKQNCDKVYTELWNF